MEIELKKDYIIYMAKFKNGQVYIGQTNRSLETRRSEHEHAASTGQQTLFYNTMRDEGIKNCEWTALERCWEDHANEREKFFINKLQASSVDIVNTAHSRKKKASPPVITEQHKENRSQSARLAGKKSWQDLGSDKWRQVDGKLKPVINLEKNIRYRSLSQADKSELDCKQTIKESCDKGIRTPHNNLYAWIDIDGNPELTKCHEKGGVLRAKKVKNLNTGKIFQSIQAAANAHNITYNNVQLVCVGKQNATRDDLVFCYVDHEDKEELTERHKLYQKEKLENGNKCYAVYPFNTDYKEPLLIGDTLKELCESLDIPCAHALEVCRGNRKHHKKYRFTFYDKITEKPTLYPAHESKKGKIIHRVICLDDNEEFSNASLAAKHYKLQSDQIRLCCKGKLKTTGRGNTPRRFAYIDKNGIPVITSKHEESLAWLGQRVFCPETGKIYPSIIEFCRETNVPYKRARKHLDDPQINLMGFHLHRV